MPLTLQHLRRGLCFLLLVLSPLGPDAGSQTPAPSQKFARGRNGMVVAATPAAAAAGAQLLEQGGNAADAAAATAFALMVTDPPMTSLGGRAQILVRLADGTVAGIDGATQAPAVVPPLAGPQDDRTGFAVVPVAGNPAALAELVRKFGRKKLSDVLRPAITLAEEGFAVSPVVGTIWEETRARLARDPGAALLYLKPDGSAYRSGESYRNPRLAALLRRLAERGPQVFYRREIARQLAADVTARGGYLRESDLAAYRALPAVVHRTRYRGHEILAVGRRAWGGTLVEMLNILEHFPSGQSQPDPKEIELLARIIARAVADRLEASRPPRPGEERIPVEALTSPEFARRRAEEIRKALEQNVAPPSAPSPRNGETTHLAVVDAAGNAVSLTTSIGPRFGAAVATAELGFLYAHSYRMRENPVPAARDETEMTPTIVLRQGQPFLIVGAAGSERIPAAILQVVRNVIELGMPLEQAVQAPRIFAQGRRALLDDRLPPALADALRQRGFEVVVQSHAPAHHFGIVHAILRDPATGELFGAADPVYDGAAILPCSAARPASRR
jgi:gamma-glutamyltranspeptidase/glutathione hydrolase